MFKHCLVLALTIAVVSASYSFTLSSTSVTLGQSVSIGWTGTCSHSNFLECYDWIAPFNVGACTGSDAVGKNTCYELNDYQWTGHLFNNQSLVAATPSHAATRRALKTVAFNATYNHLLNSVDGSWTVKFDSPGSYTFRVSYCGCGTCNLVTRDFARCDSYEQEAETLVINVLPPLDIQLSNFSPLEQFIMGFAWEEMGESTPNLMTLLKSAYKPAACSTTCFCDIQGLETLVTGSIGDFESLFENFSMAGLSKVCGDLASAIQKAVPALSDCGINNIVGADLVAEIATYAASLVSGLEEVEKVIAVAIKGESVYSELSNAILTYKLHNYFASGVNTAKLINSMK